MKITYLVVLDDGETYCSLEGARIVAVTDELAEELEGGGGKLRHMEPADGLVGYYRIEKPNHTTILTDWHDS